MQFFGTFIQNIFYDTIRMIRKVNNVLLMGFGGNWVSLYLFCHSNHTYDTFLESSGPEQCTGSISMHHVYHQDDQEAQEYHLIVIWRIWIHLMGVLSS